MRTKAEKEKGNLMEDKRRRLFLHVHFFAVTILRPDFHLRLFRTRREWHVYTCACLFPYICSSHYYVPCSTYLYISHNIEKWWYITPPSSSLAHNSRLYAVISHTTQNKSCRTTELNCVPFQGYIDARHGQLLKQLSLLIGLDTSICQRFLYRDGVPLMKTLNADF